MRLFIALCFPENITKDLIDITDRITAQGIRGNKTRKENLHLTLAFLGETESRSLPEIRHAMAAVPFEPFGLSIGQVGFFRDILWLGLENTSGLMRYTDHLRGELSRRSIWYDPKPFKPHITLIRKARGQRPEGLPVKHTAFTAEKVSLMKSEHINGRLVYTEIYHIRAAGLSDQVAL